MSLAISVPPEVPEMPSADLATVVAMGPDEQVEVGVGESSGKLAQTVEHVVVVADANGAPGGQVDPGDSDTDQLAKILQARGTPTEDEWPARKLLPCYVEFSATPVPDHRTLFTGATSAALGLLNEMLRFDPKNNVVLNNRSRALCARSANPTDAHMNENSARSLSLE